MDEKISLKAVDQYSEDFSSKISSTFFASHDKITGPEILKLCEIQQINRFVLCELQHSWKAENDKLKSPFFNYQSPEVVAAMSAFQNTLSNHISIAESDFLPLLKKAVSQTLYVVLDPYDYYSDALDRQGHGFIHVNNLKNDIKYLKINQAPLQKLVQKLEEKKLAIVPRNETFALLDAILEEVSFTPEDIDGYVALFSNVLPLDVEKFYESRISASKNNSETRAPLIPPIPETAVQKPRAEQAVNKPLDKGSRSVAENLQKIVRIKDSLTINQKFMFTKILFHGDFEIFSQAIDRLDTLDNFAQAERYLESTYPEWDQESVEYLEFREMLEKRFIR
jgi:hypothetical protein